MLANFQLSLVLALSTARAPYPGKWSFSPIVRSGRIFSGGMFSLFKKTATSWPAANALSAKTVHNSSQPAQLDFVRSEIMAMRIGPTPPIGQAPRHAVRIEVRRH
jgi:hypothetical protein